MMKKQHGTSLISEGERLLVSFTNDHTLRSRIPRNWYVRFWIGGGGSNPLADHTDIAQGIRKVVKDLLNGQYKPEQKVLAGKGITNQRLQEQRRETCLRLLTSIREFLPIAAEYRQMHDNLLMRAKMAFNSRQHMKRIKVQFQSIQNKLILAGSELSIDPNGKGVMDAFVAYMQAQARYMQAITKPMKNPLTFAFNKMDTAVLDALAKQADEQLSVLEKAAQDFIQSS